MGMKPTTLRRGFASLAVVGLAGVGVLASAGSASAATWDDGHHDLVFKPTCILGAVVGGNFEIEGVGSDTSPVFQFGVAGKDLDLGFEVEWPGSCTQREVTVVLTGSSGPGSGSAGSNYAWNNTSVTNTTSIKLNSGNGYHADPSAWSPSGSSSLTFRFDTLSGLPQTSSKVLTVTN